MLARPASRWPCAWPQQQRWSVAPEQRRRGQQRARPSGGADSALNSSLDEFIIEDAALCDTSALIVATGWGAARALWPDRVATSFSVYLKRAKEVLPLLEQPFHAVVLLRLLWDEGVIGARSAVQRAGPIVGGSSGTGERRRTRPLLVAEVAEHWPLCLDSCLLRWSIESRTEPAALLAAMQAAYDDSQQQLLLQGGGQLGSELLEQLSPHSAAVEVVRGARGARVLVASTLPPSLAPKLLAACGLDGAAAGSRLVWVQGSSWSEGLRKALSEHQAGRAAHGGGGTLHIITGKQASMAAAAQLEWPPLPQRVHSSVGAAKEGCMAASGGGAGASAGWQAAAAMPPLAGPSRVGGPQELQEQEPAQAHQQAQSSPPTGQPRCQVHLAEWSCTTASQRVRALVTPGVQLLSEHRLAELMGQGHSRLVMDGVAWT